MCSTATALRRRGAARTWASRASGRAAARRPPSSGHILATSGEAAFLGLLVGLPLPCTWTVFIAVALRRILEDVTRFLCIKCCRLSVSHRRRVWRAADQTGHLLWRLRNGHTPAAAKAPKAAVILIGTNDLGHAAEAGIAEPSLFAPNALFRCCPGEICRADNDPDPTEPHRILVLGLSLILVLPLSHPVTKLSLPRLSPRP